MLTNNCRGGPPWPPQPVIFKHGWPRRATLQLCQWLNLRKVSQVECEKARGHEINLRVLRVFPQGTVVALRHRERTALKEER